MAREAAPSVEGVATSRQMPFPAFAHVLTAATANMPKNHAKLPNMTSSPVSPPSLPLSSKAFYFHGWVPISSCDNNKLKFVFPSDASLDNALLSNVQGTFRCVFYEKKVNRFVNWIKRVT